MVIKKTVPCPVKYQLGYGKFVFPHECIPCSKCTKNRLINEITIFFIYVNLILKLFFQFVKQKINRV